MPSPLISIIIPCYNGSNYLKETLDSILSQDETRFEVIIVDDGSTDNSKVIIESFTDSRVKYFHQANQGVSSARNTGFFHSTAKYIIFFDADDIMTPFFISSRLNYLEQATSLDFISGEAQKFDENGYINGYLRGISMDGNSEILLYQPEIITCPSNYFFRRSFLTENNITFNINLSSTADRFFLLRCVKIGEAKFVESISKLNYRIAKNSMSGILTKNLVLDNQIYYEELVKDCLIPTKIKNNSLFLGDFILFASFWKIGEKYRGLKYAIRSFVRSPIGFIKKISDLNLGK
jgi:teichuronic acid biosynthesis glycosyltransferase TuaG